MHRGRTAGGSRRARRLGDRRRRRAGQGAEWGMARRGARRGRRRAAQGHALQRRWRLWPTLACGSRARERARPGREICLAHRPSPQGQAGPAHAPLPGVGPAADRAARSPRSTPATAEPKSRRPGRRMRWP
eukprot:scaffold932_cov97-Isochrysis_galbana.AAC.3